MRAFASASLLVIGSAMPAAATAVEPAMGLLLGGAVISVLIAATPRREVPARAPYRLAVATKMRLPRRSLMLLLAGLAIGPLPARPSHAVVITFYYEATVVDTDGTTPLNVSDVVTGSFAYDTATSDKSIDPTFGDYDCDLIIGNNLCQPFEASGPGFSKSIEIDSISVFDNFVSSFVFDALSINAAQNVDVGEALLGLERLQVSSSGSSLDLFSSKALPTDLDLAEFAQFIVSYNLLSNSGNGLLSGWSANVTQLSTSPLPEPAPVLLLGLAVAVLAGVRGVPRT